MNNKTTYTGLDFFTVQTGKKSRDVFLVLCILFTRYHHHCHNHDNFDSNESSNEPCSYKHDAPWFDDTCRDKKFYFCQILNKYRENKNDNSRINMSKARSEYKTALRKARISFDKKKTERLENARFKKKMQDYIRIFLKENQTFL